MVTRLVRRFMVKAVRRVVGGMLDSAISFASTNVAPKMIGTARRNENFMASSFLIPRINPEPTVIPLLEIPGNSERVWANPMINESAIEGLCFCSLENFVE